MKGEWQTKKLEDICDIERGGSPRPIQNFITTAPDGINWIKIGDATASGKYIYATEEKIKPEGVKRSRMVYEGDFILSNSMSFGRPYIMKTTGCIHDGWLVLHRPKVDPDYLYHVLSSDLVFKQFDKLAAGSTVRNLNIASVKSVEIPFPSPAEQRRIVGILDEAFAGIAVAQRNAQQNLQNARALFESHLQAIFTQRGDGWRDTLLGDICQRVSVGHVGPTSEFYCSAQDGVPFLRSQNVRRARIDWDGVQYITKEFHSKLKKSQLRRGDLLFVRVGANRGDCCAINERIGELNCANIVFARPTEGNAAYLERYCQSPIGRNRLLGMTTGAAQGVINTSSVAELVVPLPSAAEQERIVERLNNLSLLTQKLAALYQQKLTALDELKKSLLARAFAGELTSAAVA